MSAKASLQNVGLLWLRVAAGAYLMSHGLQKVNMIFNGTVFSADFQFWPDLGLGPQLAFIGLALSEFLCSALVVVGLGTRIMAIPPIFSMCVAAFIFHAQPGQTTFAEGEKALLYAIAFTTLVFTGPGRISVDRVIERWRERMRLRKQMVADVGSKRTPEVGGKAPAPKA